jgi:hypothetical protein
MSGATSVGDRGFGCNSRAGLMDFDFRAGFALAIRLLAFLRAAQGGGECAFGGRL